MPGISVLAHNLPAMFSNRELGIVSHEKAKVSEKLTSGYRINRAADDAAGLSISEKMRKQIRGLNQGTENMKDGISLCQIMDGALHEIQDELHRMNELAVKAANGTLSRSDREDIQNEISQLVAEIDRTSKSTKFNEVNPLYKTQPPMPGNADIVFVIDNTGSMAGQINSVNSNLSSFATALSGKNTRYAIVEYGDLSESGPNSIYNLKEYPFTDNVDAVSAKLTDIAGAISSGRRASGGDGPESALDGIMKAIEAYNFRTNATKEIILVTDADYHSRGDGTSSSNFIPSEVKKAIRDSNVRLSVVTNPTYLSKYGELANGKMLNIAGDFHTDLQELVNAISDAAGDGGENLYGNDPVFIQRSSTNPHFSTIHTYNVSSTSLGLNDLSCLSEKGAREGIDIVASAMKSVSSLRSQIGAEQNGLEHAIKQNENTAENTSAAESLIRDTDMAAEMVDYANKGIIEQAGQAMLAQANQINQDVLALLD